MVLSRHGLRLRHGVIRVALRCPLSETLGCHGRVGLQTSAKLHLRSGAPRRRLSLGAARFRIAAGQTRRVAVHVSKLGRRVVHARRHVAVRVRVTGIDRSGNTKRVVVQRVLRG
jgi:hypothetical protein